MFCKTYVVGLFILVAISCSHVGKTITQDKDGSKMLLGVIKSTDLSKDAAFLWFKENQKLGRTDPFAKIVFKDKASDNDLRLLVFGGTWCEDTKNLLPIFYRLVEESGFPEKKIRLIAVNREKEDPSGIAEKNGIAHVPTFIVLRKDKEIGRIVEYGSTGNFEKELAETLLKK